MRATPSEVRAICAAQELARLGESWRSLRQEQPQAGKDESRGAPRKKLRRACMPASTEDHLRDPVELPKRMTLASRTTRPLN